MHHSSEMENPFAGTDDRRPFWQCEDCGVHATEYSSSPEYSVVVRPDNRLDILRGDYRGLKSDGVTACLFVEGFPSLAAAQAWAKQEALTRASEECDI